MSRDPIQPHSMPGRYITQRLLALSDEGDVVLSPEELSMLSEQIRISVVYSEIEFHKHALR